MNQGYQKCINDEHEWKTQFTASLYNQQSNIINHTNVNIEHNHHSLSEHENINYDHTQITINNDNNKRQTEINLQFTPSLYHILLMT